MTISNCCFYFFVLLFLASCSQERKLDAHMQVKDSTEQISNKWDSTFASVKLQDTSKATTVVTVKIGQKATMYFNSKLLRQRAVEFLNNSNGMDAYSKIIRLLDLQSINDTFFIGTEGLPYFEYVISAQLQEGIAKVFYNKKNSFVPVIYHKRERYEACEYRFFYLPDQRPFFATMEMSGILEGDALFERSDQKEHKALREKMDELEDE